MWYLNSTQEISSVVMSAVKLRRITFTLKNSVELNRSIKWTVARLKCRNGQFKIHAGLSGTQSVGLESFRTFFNKVTRSKHVCCSDWVENYYVPFQHFPECHCRLLCALATRWIWGISLRPRLLNSHTSVTSAQDCCTSALVLQHCRYIHFFI